MREHVMELGLQLMIDYLTFARKRDSYEIVLVL